MFPPGRSGQTTSTLTISTSAAENMICCTFVFFQLIFFNLSQQCFLVLLQRLILFVLIYAMFTMLSISLRLTRKLVGLEVCFVPVGNFD